jgi:hypothetical protein
MGGGRLAPNFTLSERNPALSTAGELFSPQACLGGFSLSFLRKQESKTCNFPLAFSDRLDYNTNNKSVMGIFDSEMRFVQAHTHSTKLCLLGLSSNTYKDEYED